MILEGQFTLHAPIQQVWDSVLNPEVLAACVPGCEKLEIVDDKTYDAVVAAKVGSINARFRFTTKLTEIDPPKHLKAIGKGDEAGKAAIFSHEMVVDLKEISNSEVHVSYRANVSIVGKLATFGDRIMKAKAAQMQAEITQALEKRLADQSAAPAATGQSATGQSADTTTGQSEAATTTGQSEAATTTGQSEAATNQSVAPTAGQSVAPAPAGQSVALAPRQSAALGAPMLKVTFWEMFVAFFGGLWDMLKKIFKRSKQ